MAILRRNSDTLKSQKIEPGKEVLQ
jgi:hypothetical protein